MTDCRGNDYWGYNITLSLFKTGDVQTIVVGNHKLDAKTITNKSINLHINKTHIVNYSLPLFAIDSRGNKSEFSLFMRGRMSGFTERTNTYSDLEDRMDGL